MFTGLVEKKASVTSFGQSSGGFQLVIACDGWETPVSLGESISTAGCCLTVVDTTTEEEGITISFDVIHETIRSTTLENLKTGDFVNIERSLRSDSLLGGHFVQGHIDGVEHVLSLKEVNPDERRLRLSLQNIDQDTVVPKGSITLDGVSLTIATVGDQWFEVALIPATLEQTTLGNLLVDDQVNVESDILARTVVQVVRRMQNS